MDHRQRSSSPPSLGGSNGVRMAVMAVVVAVFSGYLFLLIMMPTNTYRQDWRLQLRNETASTYFGNTQGATYLVFTFPPLFVAVLGCLYLHLGTKFINLLPKGSNWLEGKMATLKRPQIVKGLGIVSWTEISFLAMFIALNIWTFAVYLRISFPKITPLTAAEYGAKVWESKLEYASFYIALVGNLALMFLFYPVTRGSSVLPLFGLTSEGSVKYHIWLGHIAMFLFTAHGLGYIVYWALINDLSEMLEWSKTGISNVAGELSLAAGLILWVTTFPRIRRKMFELFFYAHHMYILFVFFFVLHVGIGYTCYMLPGFFLFMIDRYLRFLQSRRGVRLVSARVLPCETVELNFAKSKSLSYTPTSIMFMNVPSISKLQWHPFTISSSSNLECDKIGVLVKSEGEWSSKLYQMLSSGSSLDRLDVSVEGPYGPASTDFLRHDMLVMVSGGSGIAPFISIIRELIYMSETSKCKMPSLLLISAFKNSTDLTMLDLILPLSGTSSKLSEMEFRIEAFVTRESNPTMEEKKSIRMVWLKPSPSDAPITPILGQNSWIWLGAIISSSFIIYLISIGLVTRYYIFPIEGNNNMHHGHGHGFSTSTRAVLHILFICIGIVIAATAAFLWNKCKNSKETTQIQNVEGVTPTVSPGSGYYNADRELESVPQQSLSELINLHYGERPDLKRMLCERKESSVGVLVCGPKKMRHQVAQICSSDSGGNLHFESISFSW